MIPTNFLVNVFDIIKNALAGLASSGSTGSPQSNTKSWTAGGVLFASGIGLTLFAPWSTTITSQEMSGGYYAYFVTGIVLVGLGIMSWLIGSLITLLDHSKDG